MLSRMGSHHLYEWAEYYEFEPWEAGAGVKIMQGDARIAEVEPLMSAEMLEQFAAKFGGQISYSDLPIEAHV